MKLFKFLFRAVFFAAFVLLIGGSAYYFTVTKNVALVDEKLVLPEKTTAVYDVYGEAVSYANAVARNIAKIETLNEKTIFAFVDTEDKRFFSHDGFDLKRIVKAAINNIRAGGFKEGASTISQQLVKNTHLTQEKTFKRKMQEVKLTRQLERRYTKRDILEKYLNSIYFGHSCFGIEAASQFYFGKSADKLTLGESAVLAGLVKSPNNFSPFKNAEKCKNRQATVLKLMQENGHVDQAEIEEAKKQPLPVEPSVKPNDLGYLRYVFDEMETLAEKYAFTVGGKVEIYTYLDPELQKETGKLIGEHKDVGGTAIVLDVKAHAFKACASTVGNVKRSPGSVIKPLLVYAPAVEENLLCPATPILDEKTDFNGYNPENYGGEHFGYVSARTALSKSLNVPAVKTLN
ncbi:MAG: transglycosylase domain-containing protein, partial [Clostridia bacterium]|nr:transglycosylase domain-containing protein [Clostridia bacterium]